MSLTTTNIEYGQCNWQIYRGCLHKPQGLCPVPNCWAEAIAGRQGWDFHKPELLYRNLLDPLRRKKPSRILVNFSGDLFGDWVRSNEVIEAEAVGFGIMGTATLAETVLAAVNKCPQHTFLFLTKAPHQLWDVTWPENCWMGATVWNDESMLRAVAHLGRLKVFKRTRTWLSIEPLMDRIDAGTFNWRLLDWVVIGALDHPLRPPKIEWVREIVQACEAAGVPVWLKKNLRTVLVPEDCKRPNALLDQLFWTGETAKLRQEAPFTRQEAMLK